MKSLTDIHLIIPAYNEEASIQAVLRDWLRCLDQSQIPYQIVVINDGSTDTTEPLVKEMQRTHPQLVLLSQPNSGHGPAILNGYRRAVAQGVPWILQIDADGQCDPKYFPQFWAERDTSDLIIGHRIRRDDGLSRTLVSFILRLFILLVFRTNCKDANVPYRLMRRTAVAPLLEKIPATCFFTNIILSLLANRTGLRTTSIPIRFLDRTAGKSTVSWKKMVKYAFLLYRDRCALQS